MATPNRGRRIRQARLLSGVLALAAALIVSGATPAAAGINAWTGLGPVADDVKIDGIAIDPKNPNIVYAGSDASGLFKSLDGGSLWQLMNTDIGSGNGGSAFPIAVDPTVSSTLYAGGYSGAFTSTDGGSTWQDISADLPVDTEEVVDIVAAPTFPTTLYVVMSGVMSGGSVYKMAVGEGTWTEIDADIGDTVVQLALSPHAPNTLYAATATSGVFKSVDAGAKWGAVNNGFDDPPPGILAIAVAPTNERVVYVATDIGVFYTALGGSKWTAAAALDSILGTLNTLAVAPNTSHTYTVYVGTDFGELYQSTTGGLAWTEIDADLLAGAVRSIAVDQAVPSRAFVGLDVGLDQTTDTGATWQGSNLGVSSSSIAALAIDPTASKTIYTAADALLYKSTNGGAVWLDTGVPIAPGVLAIDPTTPSTLYAGGSGLFRSTDGGNNWDNLLFDHASSIQALAIDPTKPNNLYAGTNGNGVVTSTDAGTTFAPAGLDGKYVVPLAIYQATPLTLYAAPNEGLVRGDGDGAWTAVGSGLPEHGIVYDLAFEPVPSMTMYAAVSQPDTAGEPIGLFKSTDRGETWGLLNTALTNPLAVDPEHPGTVFAVADEGIVQSTDGGSSWLRLGLQGLPVTKLLLDPMNSAKLYAGTDGYGLFTIELTAAFVTPTLLPMATPTPTFPPSDTPTPTPTFPPSDTPTPTATGVASKCTGDCDGHGTVSVDELVIGVNIALGSQQLDLCPAFDGNDDKKITVDELVLAVNAALAGCPT